MAREASPLGINEAPAEATMEDLQKQISQLKNDISGLTDTLGEYGRVQGEHLKHAARDQAAALRQKGAEGIAEAQDMATRAYEQAETSVRQNPAAALGIAAGLGFLVGLMTSRR